MLWPLSNPASPPGEAALLLCIPTDSIVHAGGIHTGTHLYIALSWFNPCKLLILAQPNILPCH